MSFVQRTLSLAIIPIASLLVLRVIYPDGFQALQEVAQPYITNTHFTHFFPSSQPSRSELPLFFTAVTQGSHVDKIAIMAVETAKLGYPITFVTGRVFEDKISKLHPNIKFSPLLGSDDLMNEEDMKTWASLTGAERELFVMKKVLVDTMPQNHDTMQALYQDFRRKHGNSKPLITLFDQTLTGHYPLLFGAPGIKPDSSIGLSIAPLSLDSNDTYPFRTGKPPHTGPDAKSIHWAAYLKSREEPFNKELSKYWWEKLSKMGAKCNTYPTIFSAFNAMGDRLLTYGIPEFEFPRSDITQDIRWFGALQGKGPKSSGEVKAILLPWWDDIAAAKEEGRKIIVVGQGTLHLDPSDLVLPTLEGLKNRSDVLVIATFVGSEPEDVSELVVPENARVAKYIPYDHLLPQVS